MSMRYAVAGGEMEMKLNERIGALRRERGLSQEQLAETLGLSRQAVAKWECGTATPELDRLIVLANLFQTTLDDLARDGDPCTARSRQACERDRNETAAFLLRAGRATYAGKGKEIPVPSAPGAHEFEYSEGALLYRDRYFGGRRFAGEETVFDGETCVWAMNYLGRTLADDFPPDFLKAALLLRPLEAPYRGPEMYREGRYVYVNEASGGFEWFIGREAIYVDEHRVYECTYHGGTPAV